MLKRLYPSQIELRRAEKRKQPFYPLFVVGANAVFKVDMVGFAFAPTLVRKLFVEKRKTVLEWWIDELKIAKKLAV